MGAALFGVSAAARADEQGIWPLYAIHTQRDGKIDSWHGLGPLIFSEPRADGNRDTGFRPFYLRRTTADGETAEVEVLYPLFFWRSRGPNYSWSVLELINHFGRKPGEPVGPKTLEDDLDIWPFYFSTVTRDPPSSTWGLFPIAGTMRHRLSRDRTTWVLWPLYLRTEEDGVVRVSTPYPFIRRTSGAGSGFAVWPLYGEETRPGVSEHRFFLWPLGWSSVYPPEPDAPAGTPPTRDFGFVPFYSVKRAPGSVAEVYLWPFFGYTDRTAPKRYHETRYFWPFLVQGRGEGRLVNRWGPFYTHSATPYLDKTWVLWPLWRRTKTTEGGVSQVRTQFYYAIYWSLEERSVANPQAAPARKLHLWPLFSYWDNGAGRVQFQALSPLAVFFPGNDDMLSLWGPLFAFYRRDQRAPGVSRSDFLWGAARWETNEPDGTSEFSLGHGLFGWSRRPEGTSWRLFGLELSSPRTTVRGASR